MRHLNKKITLILTLLVFFIGVGCQGGSRGKSSTSASTSDTGVAPALPTIKISTDSDGNKIAKITSNDDDVTKIYYKVLAASLVEDEDNYTPSTSQLSKTCLNPCSLNMNEEISTDGDYYIFAVAKNSSTLSTFLNSDQEYPEQGEGWNGSITLTATGIVDDDEVNSDCYKKTICNSSSSASSQTTAWFEGCLMGCTKSFNNPVTKLANCYNESYCNSPTPAITTTDKGCMAGCTRCNHYCSSGTN